jgi:hypothetical protein
MQMGITNQSPGLILAYAAGQVSGMNSLLTSVNTTQSFFGAQFDFGTMMTFCFPLFSSSDTTNLYNQIGQQMAALGSAEAGGPSAEVVYGYLSDKAWAFEHNRSGQ